MLDRQSNDKNSKSNSQNSSDYQKRFGMYFVSTDQPAKVVDRSVCFSNLETIIDTLDLHFSKRYDRSFMAVEVLLLKGIWQNKTYGEIAKENNYSSSYLTNVAAPKLFKGLSQLLKCRITKKTCRSKLTKYISSKLIKFDNNRNKKKQNLKYFNTLHSNYYHLESEKNIDLNLFLKDVILLSQMN